MANKPHIGISACLLGQKVRYDGEHKRNDWIVQDLGRYVSWWMVCPEVEMGLGVPREPIRLEGTSSSNVILITSKTRQNLTAKSQDVSQKIVARAPDLDGFILKKASPTCGLERVKIYHPNGKMPDKSGVGFFAKEVMQKFKDLPFIEEGRLTDSNQREHFVTQIFAHFHLRQVAERAADIQNFHQRYKFILLSHSPELYRCLGQIIANPKRVKPSELLAEYKPVFMAALKQQTSTRKRINALQHILGFFKEKLDRDEKNQIIESIQDYREGEVPLEVPLSLLKHMARKFKIDYLNSQAIFSPHPKGLIRKF